MALGTPVAAAAAYSASGGTTVAPAYPAGILASDVVLLFVGQKPTTTTGGTVTTPSGWTLRDELTGAGGYTAQGADTGNTNLRVYSWNTPVAGQTGTLTVTIGGNDVTWAFMVRIPKGAGAAEFGSADGQRTTTPTSPMSIALTNGATATNFQTGDRAIWAMCIPTDVTTPSQFSAQSITATGATFGTATELNEPDSTTGNDIGGYSAWAAVTAGSSTTAPTVTTTLTGTLTNVRGPVVLLRVREAAVTHATTGTLSGQIGSVAGSADRSSSTVTHDTSGTLAGQGSTVAGAAERTRQHATTGALTGPGSTVTGSAARAAGPVTHATSGALSGQGTTLAGTATRFRAFATSGTLAGQSSTLAGSARLNRPHATSGTLAGHGTNLAGSAARTRAHDAAAVLAGPGAIIVGSALRTGAPVAHDTTGALVADGAVVAGESDHAGGQPVPTGLRGGGFTQPWSKKALRERDSKLEAEKQERQELRELVQRALEPVKAAAPQSVQLVTSAKEGVAVLSSTGPAVALPLVKFDAAAVAREVQRALQEVGISVQRVREAQAKKQAVMAIEAARRENERLLRKRRRDEEFLLLM